MDMNKQQQARWDNAQRFGNKVASLIEKGCLVFDSNGDIVKGFMVDDGGVFHLLGDGCVLGWFLNDVSLDNGMMTTVKEFNSQFEDWAFIEPQNKNRLVW